MRLIIEEYGGAILSVALGIMSLTALIICAVSIIEQL